MVGTVNYMAPEQLRGERPDHRADIFPSACCFTSCSEGASPFRAPAAATMYKILHEVPKALDELDLPSGRCSPRS